MKKTNILILCIMLSSGTAFAEKQSEQAMELADNGVVSTDANGQSHTTIIDAGGNLKMAPSGQPNGYSNGYSNSNKNGNGNANANGYGNANANGNGYPQQQDTDTSKNKNTQHTPEPSMNGYN